MIGTQTYFEVQGRGFDIVRGCGHGIRPGEPLNGTLVERVALSSTRDCTHHQPIC